MCGIPDSWYRLEMAVFKERDFVLSLAGLELIFFITAVWCCVFQTKPVLIIDQSSTC